MDYWCTFSDYLIFSDWDNTVYDDVWCRVQYKVNHPYPEWDSGAGTAVHWWRDPGLIVRHQSVSRPLWCSHSRVIWWQPHTAVKLAIIDSDADSHLGQREIYCFNNLSKIHYKDCHEPVSSHLCSLFCLNCDCKPMRQMTDNIQNIFLDTSF